MQRKPVEVVYYRQAIDKKENKPSAKHLEAIEKLLNGEKHSVNHEPLHWPLPYDVFSIRYGEKERLLLTYKEWDGKRYLIILEDLPEHNYDNCKTKRSKKRAMYLATFAQSLNEGLFIAVERVKESEVQDDFYYYDNKFLKLTPTQLDIVSADLPQYNTGSAGGGKTLTDIAILEKKYNEKRSVLYITQRQELVAKVLDIINRKHIRVDEDAAAADFSALSYIALLKLVDPSLEHKKMVGNEEFNDWLNDYLNTHKHQQFPSDIIKQKNKIYEELRNLSGYESSVYLTLGQKECLFAGETEKKYLLQLYQLYQKHLKRLDIVDASFYEIQDFSLFEGYTIALDEVDNFSTLQIRQLIRFTDFKDMIITGDSHQLIDGILSRRSFIKRMLTNCHYTVLPTSLRCGKKIIGFSNQLINIKYAATGGRVEKDEYDQIEVLPEQHEGDFSWTGIADAKVKKLVEKYGDVELVVITHEEFLAEASKKFPHNLLMTFEQSKGQEFTHVALYRPFDTTVFAEIDKKIVSKGASVGKTKHHLPKSDERDDLIFGPAFNEVFVGCTRAIENLTICQADNHAVRHILAYLRPTLAPSPSMSSVTTPSALSPLEEKKENPFARLERAKKLLRDGNIKLAEEERVRLPEDQKQQFDEYKKSLAVEREMQAERERMRHETRREKKHVTVAPESKKDTPSLAEKSVASPALQMRKRLAGRSTIEDWTAYFKTTLQDPILAKELYRKNERKGCFLLDVLSNKIAIKALVRTVEANPTLMRNIPISILCNKYQFGDIDDVTLIACLYQYPPLHPLLEIWIEQSEPADMFKLTGKRGDEMRTSAWVYFSSLIYHERIAASKALQGLFEKEDWIAYIFDLYKSDNEELVDFTRLNLYQIILNKPNSFIRLLERQPELLFILIKSKDERPYVMTALATIDGGLSLLEEKLKNLPAFLDYLANASMLCQPWILDDINHTKTCFYHLLNEKEKGREILHILVKFNPSLAMTIREELEKNHLDYLTHEEAELLHKVFREFNRENLLALLTSSSSQRLLFRTPPTSKLGLLLYLFAMEGVPSKRHNEANRRLMLFRDILISHPALIHRVFPRQFLAMGLSSGDVHLNLLTALLIRESGRDIIKLLHSYGYTKEILVNSFFGSSNPLFERVLKEKEYHFFLDILVENDDFIAKITTEYADDKLSDGGSIFSAICRYRPDQVPNIAQRASELPLGLTPGMLIFGNAEHRVKNFYWLAKAPATHEFLLSILEKDPFMIDNIPTTVLGFTMQAWPDSEKSSAILSLTQTSAGRKVIASFVNSDKHQPLISKFNFFCQSFNGKDAMTELVRTEPVLAIRVLELKVVNMDRLSMQSISLLKGCPQISSSMRSRLIACEQARKMFQSHAMFSGLFGMQSEQSVGSGLDQDSDSDEESSRYKLSGRYGSPQ